MAGLELIISTICNATFCENVYDNPVTDTQLSLRRAELNALAAEVNGKHLIIGTYENYPLSYVETGENGTLQGRGVAFIILGILCEKFNFTYEVKLPDHNFEMGGQRPEDSLIGLLNSSKIDMAAAFLPTLIKFRSLVLFSVDIDEGIWAMMLRRPKESATGSGLLAPFKGHVWYLILAAVLSYGPCITLMTHMRDQLINREKCKIPLSPSFWFVYGAFIKQGTTLAPDANTTRVLFATWWLFIILLSAFYTANLTAFLTLSKFTLEVEDAIDLYRKNYRWVTTEGGTVQHVVQNPYDSLFYLNRMITNGRAEFRSFENIYEYLSLVDGGTVLVKEQTAIYHLMYGDYIQKTRQGIEESNRCTYVVAPNPFMSKMRAFAYPQGEQGEKLKRLFDPVLSHVIQAGLVRYLQHRDLPATRICPLDLQSKDRQLRNSDLMMTYMIMVAGLAAGVAVFIGEMVFKRCYNSKESKDSKPKKKKKHSKKYNYDHTRPPPYDSLFGQTKFNTDNSRREMINGREYWVVDNANGGKRLIPIRTPSAFLYQ